MSHCKAFPRYVLSLALLTAPTGAALAQVPEPALTPDMIRKVSAVMKEWNPLPGMGARLHGGTAGMPREKFDALPKEEQERLIVESMNQAEAKNKEGEKLIGQLHTGSLADRVAVAKGIPALSAAITRAGLSVNDFIPAFVSYDRAMTYVLNEKAFPESVKPLPAGVRKDNVDLLRPMLKAEKLWNPVKP